MSLHRAAAELYRAPKEGEILNLQHRNVMGLTICNQMDRPSPFSLWSIYAY